jgi:hypothetical protein
LWRALLRRRRYHQQRCQHKSKCAFYPLKHLLLLNPKSIR